jgi:ribosomal protein S18 acetylase RimI-like enzyme
MKAMGCSFEQWLDDDIRKLQIARIAAQNAGWSDGAFEVLFGAAHDLKGMGGSYGFPLVTQMAASLCRLIETDAGKAAARTEPGLVLAHIDALRAAVRDRITTAEHPIGRALMSALEAEVENLGVAPE